MHAYGLSVEQQDELWRRWREGEALRSVARQLGAPVKKVRRYVARTRGVRPRPVGRSARHLSLQEREEVSRLAAGWSMRRIAAGLGRPPSTVSRELARNGGRDAYRAHEADAAAYERGASAEGRQAACQRTAARGGAARAGAGVVPAADQPPLRVEHPRTKTCGCRTRRST